MLLAAVVVLLSSSAALAEPLGPVSLTAAQRRARAELVRDTAAGMGMTNAALLAGIAEVETNFAHCWSEATWACQGPASSSCGGGPVIAGSADGPCSLEQGGLGMFQFDSGTFSQTIATYGPDIVTVQGNVNAVVPFLVTRAIQSVDGVTDETSALAWMNSITIEDGDPQYEAWLYFVAWRYNGCMGCTSQINKYRNGTNKLRAEFGDDFWAIATRSCAAIPAAGRTIDETDACFVKGGTVSSWYAGVGEGGASLYTYATDAETADNHATWQLSIESAGKYRVEVFTDGGALGQTKQARYVVTDAGGVHEVVIDQSAHAGFQVLGTFDFVAGEPFSVYLGDNTGEPYDPDNKVGILFDALRVVPASTPPGTDPETGVRSGDAADGGCASGRAPGTLVLVLALGFVTRRARRSTSRISRRAARASSPV